MTLQLIHLNHHALLAIEGPDARKFLQGQVTADMQELSTTLARPGAHCTHKGRMITNFLALAPNGQDILLRMHGTTLEAASKSLVKYIVFSKAKIRNATDYRGVGICGEAADVQVAQWFGNAPAERWHSIQHENGIVTCITPALRYECWIKADRLYALLATASVQPQNGDDIWTAANIADGLGEVRGETVEHLIQQQINLQLTDGISFTKGCYTGQEIIARTHYRGALKNAMYRIGYAGNDAYPPGTEVHVAGTHNAAGYIVMAVQTGNGQCEALAVLNHDIARNGTMELKGTPVTVLTLPYEVPVGES